MKRDGPRQYSALQCELARQIIEKMQIEGWVPGTRLSELSLAQDLGVSRSPIRAALDLLAEKGLVGPTAKRGLKLIADPETVNPAEVVPKSQSEEVYAAMMLDRMNGALPREVSEAELIPRYGVSRGVVRKVLMRFAAEGLAQRQPGHGWRFAESLDTTEAVTESYQFRIALECAGLLMPTFKVDRERFRQLRHAHEQILERPNSGISREEWFRVNAAFHEALAECSGNRFVLQSIRHQNNLRRMQEYAAFEQLASGRIEQSCREHMAVLDALEAGDIDWAVALLKRHLSLAGGLPDGAIPAGD